MFGAVFIALNGRVSEPFSEINNEWCAARAPQKIPLVKDKEAAMYALENRQYDSLIQKDAFVDPLNFSEMVVKESSGDPQKYVTIINTTIKKIRFGRDKEVKVALIKNYPVHDSQL